MDFFEAQEQARRKTRGLLVFFILALVGIIAAVYLLATGVLAMGATGPVRIWNPEVFFPAALGTSAVVLGASFVKSMQLSAGGAVVANDLGGRLLDPGTNDLQERQLLNVVEEVAIASGVPVPQVYLMDGETGINAFAAGTEPSNAVIGVTRGCLERLSRSELQGVIAHEFSHILNGDMRLNMRLMGWIFGVLILMIIGRSVLYSLRHFRVRSSNSKGSGGIMLVMVAVGLGLMLIGWIGVFFARLIQAAVSRQREFLADASAVQFTREPDGLAGALKKIGGLQEKGRITHPRALEASHMFFAEGGMFTWGFATHPPLPVRIRAIEASWDGRFAESSLPELKLDRPATPPPLRADRVAGLAGLAGVAELEQLGDSSRVRLDLGRRIREGIDPKWLGAAQDRQTAQALIFSFLLAKDGSRREQELAHIGEQAGRSAAGIAAGWREELAALHSARKIALIDVCIPTLRRMSAPEHERFAEMTRWLIGSDREVDLFEYMLQHIIARHLASHFEEQGPRRIRYRRMSDLVLEANVLCSAMARLDRDGPEAARAFSVVQEEWRRSEGWSPVLLDPQQCGIEAIHDALLRFDAGTPLLKKQILRVCSLAAARDGRLSSREAELLRTIGDAIGASIPPLIYDLEEG